MNRPFRLHIYAVDRVVYDGDCVSLTLPVTDGQLGILAGRMPMAAAVVPGKLTYRLPDGTAAEAACGRGIVRFENNDALVLLDSVRSPDDPNA